MSADNKPIIVIKKKGGHGGHHGGAWKVAYADFVTAMMAFFMVMWLVNSAEVSTKKSIASYFRRPGLFEHGSGTPLLMGEAGILADAYAPTQKKKQEQYSSGDLQQVLKKKTGSEDAKKDKKITKSKGDNADKLVLKGDTKSKRGQAGEAKEEGSQGGEANKDINLPQQAEDAKKLALMFQENEQKNNLVSQDKKMDFPPGGPRPIDKAELERQMLESVKEQLEQEMIKSPELKELLGLVEVKLEADGLKIEIMDTEKSSMFSLGSARILPDAQLAFQKIGAVIGKLPNRVDIVGHTDGKPFSARAGGYSNWELSADRANAARRLLEQQGIDLTRVSGVVGRADQELRNPQDPLDPSNRRITMKIRFMNPPKSETIRDVSELQNNPRLKAPPPLPEPVMAPPPSAEAPPESATAPAATAPTTAPAEGSPPAEAVPTPEETPYKPPAGFKPKKLIQATQRAKKKVSIGEEEEAAPEGTAPTGEQPAAAAGSGEKKPFGDHPVIGPRDILLGF